MQQYYVEILITFIVSILLAAVSTPIVRIIAVKIGAIDIPKDARRIHKEPIPKLGGLAMVIGFTGGMLVNYLFKYMGVTKYFIMDKDRIGFFLAIFVITIMGFLDDKFDIKARYKLIFQFVAAVMIVTTDLRIKMISNPFGAHEPIVLNNFVSYAITIVWIMALINAFNFIDGLDGLSAGVACIASFSLFIIAIIFNRYDGAVLTIAVTGATLGFLPYNFNPAKIFMSDIGSNFLGLVIGVISLTDAVKTYAAITITLPVLVLAIPLMDTTFAIVRRMKNKQSPMVADRGHFHHRLLDSGISHRKVVLLFYSISALLGSVAVATATQDKLIPMIFLIVFAIIFSVISILCKFDIDKANDKDRG